jgi:hypothetical protein
MEARPPSPGREGKMPATDELALRGDAAGTGDEQLIGPEIVIGGAAARHIWRGQ